MDPDRKAVNTLMIAPRIVFGVFGFAFAGIGISVILFLWLTPFNQFGSPPLVFRVFGSFIALCFVAFGGTTLVGAIAGGRMLGNTAVLDKMNISETEGNLGEPQSPLNYCCPKCGAQLGKQADVSPLGDVKCSFCQQWFNIHQSPTRE